MTRREGFSWLQELVGKEARVQEVRRNETTDAYRVGPFAWGHSGGPEEICVWFAYGQLEPVPEEEVA